jgi:ferredoxin-NADP reductase
VNHPTPTFVLQPNSRWRGFRPGQFVQVRVRIEGVVHEQCYSLTGPPSETTLAITVKRRPGGVVSSFLHDHLRVGAVVEVGPAQGGFVQHYNIGPFRRQFASVIRRILRYSLPTTHARAAHALAVV